MGLIHGSCDAKAGDFIPGDGPHNCLKDAT